MRGGFKKLIDGLSPVLLDNFFFENEANQTFEDRRGQWAESRKAISNGAAYADLDGDGDLDLVVNNLNEEAFVLENRLENASYLRVALKGGQQNIHAIGARVELWQGKHYQQQWVAASTWKTWAI